MAECKKLILRHPMSHLILIIVCCISVLGTALLFILMQMYYAKYNPASPLYWRRSQFISSVCFLFTNNVLVSILTNIANVCVTVDFNFKQWIKALCYAPIFLKIKTIFDELDDLVDNALPEDILMRGAAHLGTHSSPFLNSILQQAHLDVFNKFSKRQLMSKKELTALGNLMAYKFYEQARLTLEYDKAIDPYRKACLRENIARENIEISGCYIAFVAHLIKKDPRIALVLDREEILTYDYLKTIYPSAKGGELFQILHDMSGFRFDLAQEAVIKKISANYFLAQIEKKGVLRESSHQIQSLPKRVVGFYELPEEVRAVFLQIEHLFVKDAFRLSGLTGWVLSLSWEYNYRIGYSMSS